ncbi:MAG: GatB/YqeY domain-containing protein [Ignavibacteriaceae bacterium]|nr:GatB/YqeY domain-containing protein [Ignavibacteriaceae bacterium]
MGLREIVNNEMKESMKSGDKTRLETMRSLRAAILEFEKSGENMVLTPEVELKILNAAVKKRKESIDVFRSAGRAESVAKEEAELAILMEYMPKQLNNDEIAAVVSKIAAEVGASSKADFGKLMPAVMKELKGKADGGAVKSAVEKFLGNA